MPVTPDRPAPAAVLLALATIVTLAGCAGAPPEPPRNISQIPNAQPRPLPRSPYGNPPSYSVFGETYYVLESARGYRDTGIASWYGEKFHGRRTSSGEPYDMYAMTAAHKTLPLPTFVRVTNLNNERQIVVKVNDRGPFHDDRIIDLSYTAARKLGIIRNGSAPVRVEAIVPGADVRVASAAMATPTATAPAAPAAPPPVYGHYLQAGAFMAPHNAEELAARLRAAGLSHVFVDPPDVDDFYRVRLGPFRDAVALDAARQRLRALGVSFRAITTELPAE